MGGGIPLTSPDSAAHSPKVDFRPSVEEIDCRAGYQSIDRLMYPSLARWDVGTARRPPFDSIRFASLQLTGHLPVVVTSKAATRQLRVLPPLLPMCP